MKQCKMKAWVSAGDKATCIFWDLWFWEQDVWLGCSLLCDLSLGSDMCMVIS